MGGLWRDFKLAARVLAKKPGFAAVAVATLGLGIGANTAIFSVVYSLILKPLPVPEARRLVSLTETEQGNPFPHGLSYPNVRDYRALEEVFSDVSVFLPQFLRMSVDGSAPVRLIPQVVDAGFFEMLKLHAAHGRTFQARDVERAANLLVLSHSAWQRHFAGDTSIVGKSVNLADQPFTVLGVTPEEFHGTIGVLEVDGYLPLRGWELLSPSYTELKEDRAQDAFRVIAKLQPGVGLDAARAAVRVQSSRLASEYPEANKGQTVLVHPEPMARMEPAAVAFMPPVATVFMLMVSLVLVIACANVANLLLARGTSRQKEMAIRLSLGARRGQVLRQLLAESLMLSLLGAVAALAIAQWAGSALSSFSMATDLPLRLDFSLDYSVLMFALGVAVLTGLLTGLLPGLRAGRADLVGDLKEGGRGSGGASGRHVLRSVLVGGQVLVSVVLLVCAGLFVRTARNATDIDLGFELDNRLMLTFDMGLAGYEADQGRAFHEELLRRVRSLPGVLRAASGQYVPVGYGNELQRIHVEGVAEAANEPPKQTLANVVTPDFFLTLGTPLLAGRAFSEDDQAEGRPVAIVNQTVADAYWPGEESIGKRISLEGPDGPFLDVVGVVKTAKYTLPAESPIPMVYRPFAQNYRGTQTLFVQTESDPLGVLPAIRTQIRALDPEMPLYDVRTLESHIRDGKARLFGLGATIVGIFALIGCFLASIGIYGVAAYAVGQRQHEIGVRMALGAEPRRILVLILKQGAVLASVGVSLGLLISFYATSLLGSYLVGVTATDPLTFGGVALLLGTVTVAACAVPALQAARVDPLIALHYE